MRFMEIRQMINEKHPTSFIEDLLKKQGPLE